ncbi:MAG: methyl-accepting chemotaxis protein [Bacteroidota bacterium]
MLKRISIRNQLFFLVLGISLLTFTICFYVVINRVSDTARKEGEEKVRIATVSKANAITSYFNDLLSLNRMYNVGMDRYKFLNDEERQDQIYQHLKWTLMRNWHLSEVWAKLLIPDKTSETGLKLEQYRIPNTLGKTKAEKTQLEFSSEPFKYSDTTEFYKAYKRGVFVDDWLSEPLQLADFPDSAWHVTAISRMHREGKFGGVSGTSILINATDVSRVIFKNLVNFNAFQQSYAIVFTDQGTIVAHPDQDRVLTSVFNLPEFEKVFSGDAIFKAKNLQVVSDYINRESDENLFVSVCPVALGKSGLTKWFVASVVPSSQMTKAFDPLKFIIAGIGVIGFGILFIAIFRVSKSIINSLRETMGALDELASGNYALRTMRSTRQDELGKMNNAVNLLVEDLNKKSAFAEQLEKGHLERTFQKSGEKDVLGKALLSLRASLEQYISETKTVIIDAGEKGNLSSRVSQQGKSGVWLELSKELNALLGAINAPFADLNNIADAMATGNLSARLSKDSAGDIKQLSLNLNLALDNVTSLLKEIVTHANTVNSSSNQMQALSDQMSLNAEEIASAISEMSSGARNQVGKVDESSLLAERILNAATDMHVQAKSINEAADAGTQLSDSGFKLVEKTSDSMKEISEFSVQNNESFQNLQARTKEMAKALGLITEISQQTNLLSLNAAIEAAQAGEAGRGFGVVAEEIRKLAEDSKKSANEIGSLLVAIQNDTEASAELMGKMTLSIKKGEETMTEAATAFTNIADASKNTFLMSGSIVEAADKQIENIKSIVGITENIVVIAEETAAGTEEVATSATELSSGMKRLDDRSQDLENVAKKLQEGVDRFHLAEE